MSSPFLDKDLRSLSQLMAEWQTETNNLVERRKQISARIRLLQSRMDIIRKVIEEEPPLDDPLL